LGLSVEKISQLQAADLDDLRQQLFLAWSGDVGEHAVWVSEQDSAQASPPPMTFVRVLDQSRAAEGQGVVASARLSVHGRGGRVETSVLTLDHFGLSDASLVLRALGDEARFEGTLRYDTSWGGVAYDALGGHTLRERIEALEPYLRRGVASLALSADETIHVIATPQAPVALWFAEHERVLLINPNVLFLIQLPKVVPVAAPIDTPIAQAPPPVYSIDACVDDQLARCERCLTASDGSADDCTPHFTPLSGAFESDHLGKAECRLLRERPDLLEPYCTYGLIQENRSCFITSAPVEACGDAMAHLESSDDFERALPALTDVRCQDHVLVCMGDIEPLPDAASEPALRVYEVEEAYCDLEGIGPAISWCADVCGLTADGSDEDAAVEGGYFDGYADEFYVADEPIAEDDVVVEEEIIEEVIVEYEYDDDEGGGDGCLLYTSQSPRDRTSTRMPSSA